MAVVARPVLGLLLIAASAQAGFDASSVDELAGCTDFRTHISSGDIVWVTESGEVPTEFRELDPDPAVHAVDWALYLACFTLETTRVRESPAEFEQMPGYAPGRIVPGVPPPPPPPEVEPELQFASRTFTLTVLAKTGANASRGGCNDPDNRAGMSQLAANARLVFTVTYRCVFADFGSGSSRDAGTILGKADTWAAARGLVGTNKYALAWAGDANHNGLAYIGGRTAMAAEGADYKPDWDQNMIVQHEMSHVFGADDKGTWCDEGKGVMNFCHAYWGYQYYDADSYARVRNTFGPGT